MSRLAGARRRSSSKPSGKSTRAVHPAKTCCHLTPLRCEPPETGEKHPPPAAPLHAGAVALVAHEPPPPALHSLTPTARSSSVHHTQVDLRTKQSKQAPQARGRHARRHM
eukprot:7269994-Prymnesium_polylepis.1